MPSVIDGTSLDPRRARVHPLSFSLSPLTHSLTHSLKLTHSLSPVFWFQRLLVVVRSKVVVHVIRTTQSLDVEVQVDISETRTFKGMYFQLVDNQVLSTQGQPDVNLHRLTLSLRTPAPEEIARTGSGM